MISGLLASALVVLLAPQAPAPRPGAVPHGSPAVVATPTPSEPTTPTDEFGPDLKAWLDANKLQDQDTAAKALANLQRRRAERNLSSVDDVAGAIAGRAEVRAVEGSKSEAAGLLGTAITFAPDSATYQVLKADLEGKTANAWQALDLALANPLEEGRLKASLLLGLLVVGALFASGFAFALLLRYGAVFSHDVAEGLSDSLKSLTLFMAVLFVVLPLGGLLGWGYLPFWWVTLFFIFESRAEKVVSVALLLGLAFSSLALPLILRQRSVDAARDARQLYLVANGGTSAEGEALVKSRLAADPSNVEWSLLSANLSRRGGRFDEASAALLARSSADARFAHNAGALDLNRGNFAGAYAGFSQASGASLSSRDKATAFYNLSLVQVNTLAFDQSKDSRKKGDGLDAPLLARYDRLFSFYRDGSTLQAAPDIVPDPSKILGAAIPGPDRTFESSVSRVTLIAIGMLLFIPAVVKFRGVQSFSKQCPKCGTTFCWLCQTRSTSQDVCSQCHHLFVVKRGIPPLARAAKNAEITAYVSRKALLHRISSLAAPGSGHLAAGHFNFGLPVLALWSISAGALITVRYVAPLVVAGPGLGSVLTLVFGSVAGITYVVAQAVKPRPPVVAAPPRRIRPESEA